MVPEVPEVPELLQGEGKAVGGDSFLESQAVHSVEEQRDPVLKGLMPRKSPEAVL